MPFRRTCSCVKYPGNANYVLTGRSHTLRFCICATCVRHGKPYCALGSERSSSLCILSSTCKSSKIVDSPFAVSLLIFSVASRLYGFVILAVRRNFSAGRMFYYVVLQLLSRRSSSIVTSLYSYLAGAVLIHWKLPWALEVRNLK